MLYPPFVVFRQRMAKEKQRIKSTRCVCGARHGGTAAQAASRHRKGDAYAN